MVSDAGTIVCKPPAAYKLPDWCVQWAATHYSKQLTQPAARLLVDLVGAEMGQLDQELASVYRRLLLTLLRQDSEALDKSEDEFLIVRRRCGDHRACIEQSYRNRIRELKAALPKSE